MSDKHGTAGNDSLQGSQDADTIDISQGGIDTVAARGGDDQVYAGGTLTGEDRLDGGDGHDFLDLNGDYSAGVVLSADSVGGFENIALESGHDYNLTFTDGDYRLNEGYLVVYGLQGYATEANFHIDFSAVQNMNLVLEDAAGDDWLSGAQSGTRFQITGGRDTVIGGSGDDVLDQQGNGFEALTFSGGDGNDRINFDFDADDRIDGGAGYDTVKLQYGIPDTLKGVLTNVEELVLPYGRTYSFVVTDDVANANLDGGVFTVNGAALYDTTLVVDGSRVHHASLDLIGGNASEGDTLVGGSKGDILDLSQGRGDDHASGGLGNDTILVFDGGWDGADRLDGGGGKDTIEVTTQDYSLHSIRLGAQSLQNIEVVKLDVVADITFADGNVAAGGRMTVIASAAGVGAGTTLDASSEQDGSYDLRGAQDPDTLIGGGGADTLSGGGGADKLTGGAGVDHFVYASVADSAPGAGDIITDLSADDVIDLRGIDANAGRDGDQHFKLVDHFTDKAGQAVLSFDAKSNITTLSLDVNGDGASDADIRLRGDHTDFTHFAL